MEGKVPANIFRVSNNNRQTEDIIRLEMVREVFFEWFSRTYIDKNGILFDSEGKILAKVNFFKSFFNSNPFIFSNFTFF